MWSRLLNRRPTAPRRLSHDDVRRIARDFLSQWDPFRQRYAQSGDVLVEPAADVEPRHRWAATATPAKDVRCGLVIADEPGQVVEARLVAMRTGAVLAEWHALAPDDGDVPPP